MDFYKHARTQRTATIDLLTMTGLLKKQSVKEEQHAYPCLLLLANLIHEPTSTLHQVVGLKTEHYVYFRH